MDERPSLSQRQVRPVLAFTCILRGSTLVARAYGKDLVVRAPRKFLQALTDWCDGKRTLDEVNALATEAWGPSTFAAFLLAMLEGGLLVEASNRYLHSLTIEASLSHSHGRPLHPAGKASVSGPQPCAGDLLSLDDRLRTILKSLFTSDLSRAPAAATPTECLDLEAAVKATVLLVKPEHGVSPAILKLVPEAAGTFRIAGSSELDRARLCRAMQDPYLLMGIDAMVVLSLDVTAAATAEACAISMTRGAFIAAGRAIQRAVEASSAVDAVFTTTQRYDAGRLAELCGIEAHAVLSCGLIKQTRPAGAEETGTLRLGLRLQWMNDAPDDFGRHMVCARIASAPLSESFGWGRSVDAAQACAIAVSEAVERHSYRRASVALIVSRGASMNLSIDPRRWVRFSETQYRDSKLGLVPYRDDEERHWVAGTDAETGREVWLPADCVLGKDGLPPAALDRRLMRATSSGCASDTSFEIAMERASFEVIERDAFVRHWLAQTCCASISLASLPGDFSSRLQRLADQGLVVDLGSVSGDLGPVIVVGLTSELHGFCSIGTACGPEPVASLDRALAEAEVAAFVRLKNGGSKRVTPRTVATPTDHGQLFAQRRYFRRAHALLRGGPIETWASLEHRWPSTIRKRLERHRSGLPAQLVCVDLSAVDAPRAFDGQPVRTVRAMIPDTLPIAFGYDALPRGMGTPSCMAGRFPHPLP